MKNKVANIEKSRESNQANVASTSKQKKMNEQAQTS
jgi:hypothetical protein